MDLTNNRIGYLEPSSNYNSRNIIDKIGDNQRDGEICKILTSNVKLSSKPIGEGGYGAAYLAQFKDGSLLDGEEKFIVKFQELSFVKVNEKTAKIFKRLREELKNEPHDTGLMTREQYVKIFSYKGSVYFTNERDEFVVFNEACQPSEHQVKYTDDSSKFVKIRKTDIVCSSVHFIDFIMSQIISEIYNDYDTNRCISLINTKNMLFCETFGERKTGNNGFFTIMPYADKGDFHDILHSFKKEKFILNIKKEDYNIMKRFTQLMDEAGPGKYVKRFGVPDTKNPFKYDKYMINPKLETEFNLNLAWIITHIVYGIYTVQRYGIMHNDLRPDNIFMNSMNKYMKYLSTSKKNGMKYYNFVYGKKSIKFPYHSCIKYVPRIADWGLASRYRLDENADEPVQVILTDVLEGERKDSIINHFQPAADLAYLFLSMYGRYNMYRDFESCFEKSMQISGVNINIQMTRNEALSKLKSMSWVDYEMSYVEFSNDFSVILGNEYVLSAAEYIYSKSKEITDNKDIGSHELFNYYISDQEKRGNISRVDARILRLRRVMMETKSRRVNTYNMGEHFEGITPEGCLDVLSKICKF